MTLKSNTLLAAAALASVLLGTTAAHAGEVRKSKYCNASIEVQGHYTTERTFLTSESFSSLSAATAYKKSYEVLVRSEDVTPIDSQKTLKVKVDGFLEYIVHFEPDGNGVVVSGKLAGEAGVGGVPEGILCAPYKPLEGK